MYLSQIDALYFLYISWQGGFMFADSGQQSEYGKRHSVSNYVLHEQWLHVASSITT